MSEVFRLYTGNEPKKKSTFQKVTMVVVVLMLIATIAGVVLGAISQM
ncbi:Protein of unknown function [Pilibacter termitis]|uniref:DUF4044 domain-containing protein n=1 Tax=Pilibacter termitis TaxID=263852 RepID=A0A1T4KEC6_9ENTE|nr:DUF4044 domain-containing protein [Pilibacter termitis]SJZ40751.1 Protein of unknown function [Pilibacter termitis]